MRSIGVMLALCLVPLPTAAQIVEYVAVDGAVRALDGPRVLWENRHDRQRRFRAQDQRGRLTLPRHVEGWLYYAVGDQLYQVDPRDGSVADRLPLPGPCTGIGVDADTLVVDVGGIGTGPGSWAARYRLDPRQPRLPYFQDGTSAARLLRGDAENVLADRLAMDPDAPAGDLTDAAWRRSAEARPWVEGAAEELAWLSRRDPTNPWYRYQLGVHLQELARDAEARAAFDSVLELDEAWAGELLGLALPLDRVDPDLGDRAFERALRFRVARGYDPGMAHSLYPVLIHYGRPGGDEPRDADRLDHLAGRLWALAPRVEGTAGFYASVANALRDAGRDAPAAVWEQRARSGPPQQGLVSVGSAAARTGPAFNALIATLLALLFACLVKGLRYLPSQRRAARPPDPDRRGAARPPDSDHRGAHGPAAWNPLAFWTRSELVGLLVVLAALLASATMLSRGVGAISRAAAFPLGAGAGNYGHPAAVTTFETLRGSPGGDFLYALALHKAERLEEAESAYAGLADARALNNLGALRARQGRPDAAQRLFEQARDADPELAEARANLGTAVDSDRLERLRRWGREPPFLALPSDAQWDDALAGGVSPLAGLAELMDLFSLGSQIAEVPRSEVVRAGLLSSALPVALPVALPLLLGVLALLGLKWRPSATLVSSRLSRVGWAMGLIVPGTARQLGAFGTPLLALAAFSLVVSLCLSNSAGSASDPLGMIVMADLSRSFGVWSPFHPPLEQAVRASARLWWLIWIANIVAVLLLEGRWPDPCGPRAAASLPARRETSPAP